MQMHWYNEPETWQSRPNGLSMFVTGQTDYWRKTHYGFTVDDGPFYYARRGGEFETGVVIRGDYKSRYDQMGLMIRKDQADWLKFGIEFLDEYAHVSSVVTHDYSDWSMVKLDQVPPALHLKAVRRLDAIELFYALDGADFHMQRLTYFPAECSVEVGMMAASPDGQGFEAEFDAFYIRHLPDQQRLEWLSAQGE